MSERSERDGAASGERIAERSEAIA